MMIFDDLFENSRDLRPRKNLWRVDTLAGAFSCREADDEWSTKPASECRIAVIFMFGNGDAGSFLGAAVTVHSRPSKSALRGGLTPGAAP
jgi:hypothetical protein